MNIESNSLKIINHYGLYNQIRKFQEEVFELNEALLYGKYLEEKQDYETLIKARYHIVEELADVMVMLKQFQKYFDIKDENINKIMNYKIERQLNRMEVEKSVGRN